MPVPLLLDTTDGADGRTRVVATLVGGKSVVALPPFMPYAYTDRPIASPGAPRTLKSLSTLQPETWYFGEWQSARRRGWQLKTYRTSGGRVAEDLRFIEQIVADKPDFIRGLADASSRPRVLYVDIEQKTDGESFPKPLDPVVSIAWAIDDGPVQVIIDRTGETTVQRFIEAYRAADPDIVAGFYHEGYDLPVIIAHLGNSASLLTRDGSLPELLEKPEKDGKVRKQVKLGGRVCWDVKPSTEIDMEISGCEDRKLKTIADWLDIPYLVAEDYDIDGMSDDELAAYNVSDVTVLRTIAARYLGDRLALAEDVGTSYDRVLNGGSAYASGIHAARSCALAGVVSDATNGERYDHVIPRETEGPRKGFPMKPEGATVGIMRPGRHAPLEKVDFASLYPSLIVALGMGPDNVRLVGSRFLPDDIPPKPLTLVETRGETRVYHVADRKLKQSFIFEVIGRSVFADRIAGMMRERLALKAQAKKEPDPVRKRELEARTYIAKVIVNSAFGYMGADYAPHGSKGVFMLILAGGRAMLDELQQYIGPEHVVEVDTDGVYYAGRSCQKADVVLAMRLASLKYGMDSSTFDLDVDRFEAAYFYEAKQYLLLEDGEMSMHGAAFKGTAHAALFRKTVDSVGLAVLRGDPSAEQIARRALDLTQYPSEDFVKRVKYSGKPKAHVGRQVAESYVKLHGRMPDRGERMLYVKTTEGYEVVTPESLARIDSAYYLKTVKTALDRLGFGAIGKQRSLRSVSLRKGPVTREAPTT